MAGKGTVGDYVTLQRGITYKGNLVGKPGPALLGLGSIQPGGGFREGDYKTYGGECPPKLMLFPGDLFVSLKGATKDGKMIGSVARVPASVPSGRLTQDTVKLEFREKNPETAKFLYWVLRTPQYRDYCDGRATGSAVVALSREDFLGYPAPPITQTRLRIVELLETLDDKIELNRRCSATLEAMARALFQSWFVDFNPVRAKLDDREPAGMDGETARLFPSHFSESELGMIPRGWAVASFSEMFEIPLRNGLTRPKSVRGAGTRMVNMGELFSNRRIGNIEMDRVPLEGEELSRNLLEPGDLLFARQSLTLAGAGQCSVIIEAKEPRTFESHLIRCRLDKQKSNSWFYFYYFLSPQGRARVVSIVEQVAAAGIRGSDLGRMKVLIPPVELQQRFGEIVTPFEQQISANEDQSRTLATLRDTLLPKLLSGELSVAGGSI